MYSVVLVMALAGTAEAPECHRGSCGCFGFNHASSCGCFGGNYNNCAPSCGCYGGNYNYSSSCGCNGGNYGGGGMIYTTPAPAEKMPEKIGEPKKGKDLSSLPTPGTIVVTLPSNAKLTVDGYVTQQTSNQRVLVTPPIQRGQDLTYTLVAETTENGQLVSQTQQVTVRPGQQSPVNFTFPTAPAATSR
jgi:uncharacterized protein (TIGR03000 family)